jgi:hypothetical protein
MQGEKGVRGIKIQIVTADPEERRRNSWEEYGDAIALLPDSKTCIQIFVPEGITASAICKGIRTNARVRHKVQIRTEYASEFRRLRIWKVCSAQADAVPAIVTRA